MEQELIVERTRAVAGSRDRTLRVWVAERRGDYHLHRRGSYLQLFRATAWKTREGPFP